MKKRILTLALALVLIFSAVALPVHAATGKEVHAYMKSIALKGSYSDEDQAWYYGFQIGSVSAGSYYFVIGYMEKTKYVHNSIVYISNDSNYLSWEVTWKISSDPSPSYNAFVEVYDKDSSANDTRGVVVLPANYSGGAYSSFKTFTGNTNFKAAMLDLLNTFLPGVLEYTRAVINEQDYSLATLGMTGYRKCDWIHAYDHGVVSQPTCADPGTRTYTCRVCGETTVEVLEPALGHAWDDGVEEQTVGCETNGIVRYSCSRCGETKEEITPALGHAWDEGTELQALGCITDGVVTYSCSRCGKTKEEITPALGHAWTLTEVLEEGEGGLHACTGLDTCIRCEETKEAPLCAAEVFTDMPAEGNWAHDPID